MCYRRVPLGTMLLLAVLLIPVPGTRAGDRVRAGSRPASRIQPASATVVAAVAPPVRVPASIAVAVTKPAQPAAEPLYVDIRGLDGQVRRFPVEGGSAAIQYRQVLLHPGEMLTIQWSPTKQSSGQR